MSHGHESVATASTSCQTMEKKYKGKKHNRKPLKLVTDAYSNQTMASPWRHPEEYINLSSPTLDAGGRVDHEGRVAFSSPRFLLRGIHRPRLNTKFKSYSSYDFGLHSSHLVSHYNHDYGYQHHEVQQDSKRFKTEYGYTTFVKRERDFPRPADPSDEERLCPPADTNRDLNVKTVVSELSKDDSSVTSTNCEYPLQLALPEVSWSENKTGNHIFLQNYQANKFALLL